MIFFVTLDRFLLLLRASFKTNFLWKEWWFECQPILALPQSTFVISHQRFSIFFCHSSFCADRDDDDNFLNSSHMTKKSRETALILQKRRHFCRFLMTQTTCLIGLPCRTVFQHSYSLKSAQTLRTFFAILWCKFYLDIRTEFFLSQNFQHTTGTEDVIDPLE